MSESGPQEKRIQDLEEAVSAMWAKLQELAASHNQVIQHLNTTPQIVLAPPKPQPTKEERELEANRERMRKQYGLSNYF